MEGEVTKDYCLCCKQEMRKWPGNGEYKSMCVNDKCIEQGVVHRAIVDHNNFKIQGKSFDGIIIDDMVCNKKSISKKKLDKIWNWVKRNFLKSNTKV